MQSTQPEGDGEDFQYVLHQASGMVAAQLDASRPNAPFRH
jgi:hypothetical protein